MVEENHVWIANGDEQSFRIRFELFVRFGPSPKSLYVGDSCLLLARDQEDIRAMASYNHLLQGNIFHNVHPMGAFDAHVFA